MLIIILEKSIRHPQNSPEALKIFCRLLPSIISMPGRISPRGNFSIDNSFPKGLF